MKIKIFAAVAIITVIGAVVINTVVLNKEISSLARAVSELNIRGITPEESKARADALFTEFKKKEPYISITVSHDDLTNIEDGFAELIGYLSVEDKDGAEVTKYKLENALLHLRRLSGFNIDSII
ncbi:MAG: DUF4363 family protein [Clostridia bacterium]|nr:DUF4363 family protein [Clostridia bacterium]MBO5206131.1 DUF4363 family protein [Clostridia bacterium]MBP3584025.1 DUF4363 family protein [Clostridia bacterium]